MFIILDAFRLLTLFLCSAHFVVFMSCHVMFERLCFASQCFDAGVTFHFIFVIAPVALLSTFVISYISFVRSVYETLIFCSSKTDAS